MMGGGQGKKLNLGFGGTAEKAKEGRPKKRKRPVTTGVQKAGRL